VQAQRGQVILLLLHTLLPLFDVALFHLGEHIEQLLHLQPVLVQQVAPLFRGNALNLLQILVKALL
jgi:hypothetical protein